MFIETFYVLFSGLLAIGFSLLFAMFYLIFSPPVVKPDTIKASDILIREGYTSPPRTRRRKEFAYV